MKNLVLLLALLCTTSAWAQSVSPSNRSQTTATQPAISVHFRDRVYNPRIWVDGIDFTRYARSDGNKVTLTPPYPLDNGIHEVRVTTHNGQQAQWSFAIGNRDLAQWDDNGKKSQNKKNKKDKKNKKYDDDDDWNRRQRNSDDNNGLIDASRYGPPMGSVVTVSNPPISVAFNGTVQNLRMLVDGRDVTGEAVIGNEGISWAPRSNLSRGQHSVQVTGNARNGQPVSGNWHFFVQY